MKTWEMVFSEVEKQLSDNSLEYTHDGNGYFQLSSCIVEVVGSLFKPEYWVNETRCHNHELVQLVMKCENQQ
ncbi:hypothetical protein AAXB25_14770 [Paenibacillus lautus]|uniref:hypothetical protein n=1 Tax=Paenibacillus lautus TaxID=1401 RepID=UPI003D2BC3A4